jgi:hypothetical protein
MVSKRNWELDKARRIKCNMNYVSVINLCVQKKVSDASEIELVCC